MTQEKSEIEVLKQISKHLSELEILEQDVGIATELSVINDKVKQVIKSKESSS